ncbi:MAG: hypothetical protein HOC74_27460 [Gemmatimonadetes bacterium]|jgi:hypothetical protein|nr:hypothetical protein [Gemmatimonadota bacterium]
MRGLSILVMLLTLSSCGRYFHTPLRPSDDQTESMTINDDGSITYNLDRLSIDLKPMTDAELNRFTTVNSDLSLNPYTFGDWAAPGDDWTPARFTVFRLKVNNYQYPKVKIDPLKARITTSNNRQYRPLSFAQLYDYYRAHWQGRTGQGRKAFQNRTDVLKRTLYSDAMIFSGREEQGFLVFPVLHDDVGKIEVHIEDIVLRFDFADVSVEEIDLSFSFQREIHQGYTPAPAARHN